MSHQRSFGVAIAGGVLLATSWFVWTAGRLPSGQVLLPQDGWAFEGPLPELIVDEPFSFPQVSSWEFQEEARRQESSRRQEITEASATYRRRDLAVPVAVRRALIVLREDCLARKRQPVYCNFMYDTARNRLHEIGPAAIASLRISRALPEFAAIRSEIDLVIAELKGEKPFEPL